MATPARDKRPEAVYWALVQRGLTPDEAGNLTAWLVGLPPAPDCRGWTPAQIEAELFLEWLVRTGRLPSGASSR